MNNLLVRHSDSWISGNGLVRAYDLLAQVPAEQKWIANYLSENTRANYRRTVSHFIVSMQLKDSQELYNVSVNHIIAYRDFLLRPVIKGGLGLRLDSVAVKLSILSSLYKVLADERLCVINPVSGVMRPKTQAGGIDSGKTPALTPVQVRQMLNAPDTKTLKGLRDSALLHVFFYTGGRCSEPSHLRVRDFRMDREYWILEMTIKGGKTNTIAIHTECQIAIRRYLDASGHGEDPDAWLFQAIKGGRNKGQAMSRIQFYRLFKCYAKRVGLPSNITPHSARATFITEAYENGLEGESIQRTVGHSSITTTEGYNRTAKKHRKSASFVMNF